MRVYSEEIIVSSVCGISTEQSRMTVKTVCKHLYDHEYHLSKNDISHNTTEDEPPQKKKANNNPADRNEIFYVLPSAKTVASYKHMQASQVELDAALELYHKSSEEVSTMHYELWYNIQELYWWWMAINNFEFRWDGL